MKYLKNKNIEMESLRVDSNFAISSEFHLVDVFGIVLKHQTTTLTTTTKKKKRRRKSNAGSRGSET
jgi:hypothetical protein